MSSMNNKVNASPPSANKSRSNSTSVQHDQIPINSSSVTHSSASYKQELMDSSVLLDNINEALSIWDNTQSNSQTLPAFNININNNLFSPSLSSTNNNNNQPLINITPPNKHSYNSTHRKRRHSHHKRHYKSNHGSPSNPPQKEEIAINAYGLHQTYIKDDSGIQRPQKHHKKTHKSHNSNTNSSKHHKHKPRHQNHHHNISRTPINIRNVDDIPSFVTENDRRLTLLAEMIELKRSELERISGRHDYTLSCIINLYISATASVISLRKQHRDLSSFAEQLSREGQIRNTISDNILSTLHNIEEQRKNLLNKIESPSWEIKHHFHILSFEHFRGNQQPHLLEIAQVLPSRLQIAAISHQSTIKNEKLLKEFNIAQKERDLLYKKLSQIDKKRSVTQCHLKDYKKMMTIIKKNIGEKRLNKLKTKQQQSNKNNPIQQTKNKMHLIQQTQMQQIQPIIAQNKNNNRDRFRRQYLGNIGITMKEKKKFNLVEFVTQINRYLCLTDHETERELTELTDNTDLINPITGQINNPSNSNANGNNNNNNPNGNDNEEKKQDNEKKLDKNKSNKAFEFKEKLLRQNVLNIIDRNIFVIHEEKRTEKENIVKTVYSISMKNVNVNGVEEKKEDVNMEENMMDDNNDMDMDIEIATLKSQKSAHMKSEENNNNNNNVIDAPHRDWSVLAKHLKDSSKEQARRKQILKQLERILHVREGLIVGFEQLKEIYTDYQNKKIQKNK